MVAELRVATELSSVAASSTMRRFGDFFGLRMAVETSSGPGPGGAPLGSAIVFVEEMVVRKEGEDW